MEINKLERMKAMMNYGLQTEGKKSQFSGVEYTRNGADGKTYGIVREGTKYYIKVSDKKTNVLKEDFDYIGGFRNRKDNEYASYANALKNFEMKMKSINEAVGTKQPLIESWNPDKKEMLAVESTDRMRREIARQREIMGNATLIQETKNYSMVNEACVVDKDAKATQKPNMKKEKAQTGDAKTANGDPFVENPDKEFTVTPNMKNECGARVNEGEQVLGWNDDENYLDTANGTEIGDGDPFEKCANGECQTVEEGVAMHNSDNLHTPEVGTNEVGDDDPFIEVVTESDDDFDVEDDVESEDVEAFDDEEPVEDVEDKEFDSFEGEDLEAFDDEKPVEDVEDDLMGCDEKLDKIIDLLTQLVDKSTTFEDDDLYDEEDDDEDEEEITFESRDYRRVMQEDRLNYFGKHPAYRKRVMELPTAKHAEKEGYYDMNDETVKNERPFGEKIGDGTPFEVSPEAIENAIAEAIRRTMKKKI